MKIQYNGVQKGICNKIRSTAENYLHFGRNVSTIYTKDTDTLNIVGKTIKEPIALTALRTLSWATVFFPLLALAAVKLIQPAVSNQVGKHPVFPEGRKFHEQQAIFGHALNMDGIETTAYSALFPRYAENNMPFQIFDSNQPYNSKLEGFEYINELKDREGIAFLFGPAQARPSLKENFPNWRNHWTQLHDGPFTKNGITLKKEIWACLLAPSDQKVLESPTAYTPLSFSKAFREMLQSN